MPKCTLTFLLLLTIGASWTPAAANTQSHDSIRQAAAEHVRTEHQGAAEELVLKVGRLDSRLRLPQCDGPLDTFSPSGRSLASRQTVGVRCSTGQPWSLYVPVNVRIMKKILVASRELPRGSVLGAEDLELEERDVARLRAGYFEHPGQALGKITKRTIHRNDALLPTQVLAPQAVERGSKVTILARAGALQVRMTGKALSGGSKGDLIEVVNESSQKRIEGRVIAPGLVEVPL